MWGVWMAAAPGGASASSVGGSGAQAHGYTDIAGHWAESAIVKAAGRGLIDGYADGTFRPNAAISRADYAVLLVRALGLKAGASATRFADIPTGSAYAGEVAAAYDAGLIRGAGQNRFAPNAHLSREQLAVLLVRAYAYKTNGDAKTSGGGQPTFKDVADISAWALNDVSKAVGLGLMNGRGGNRFMPLATVTRAEAVAAVLNFLNNAAGTAPTTPANPGAQAKATDWTALFGGIFNSTGQRAAAPTLTDTGSGIQIKGKGNYDFAGHAVGAILNEPVDRRAFTAEIRLDQVAGWGSDGVDSWFNLNLLNRPSYFTLQSPGSAKGITLFVRPQESGKLGIEVYRLSEPQPGDESDWVPGWKGIGGGTLQVAWNTPLKIEFATDASNVSKLTINGQTIEADWTQISDGWFDGNKAYFSIGAANATDNEVAYTIKSINGKIAGLQTDALAAQENGPWDVAALKRAPDFAYAPKQDAGDGVSAIFYQGLPYKGKQTKVFAYMGIPEHKAGEKLPAVVLVHGGLGTAFADWVKQWNSRGYAAIAMDLEGHLPNWNAATRAYEANKDGGPANQAVWQDINARVEDQWTYHAVADIMLAHSLLREQPGVDAQRIGITGVSWGGVLTEIAVGVDDRFAFAVPVYGSGYVHESESYFGDTYRGWSKETQQKFMKLWEPSAYLTRANLPMLWVNGDRDEHFPLTVFSKSYRLVSDQSVLSIQPGMLHGQEHAVRPAEIYAFADSVVSGGTPLARIVGHERSADNKRANVRVESAEPIVRIELYYTKSLSNRAKPEWVKQDIAVGSKADRQFAVDLPGDAKAYYINLIDAKGYVVSTALSDL